MSYYKEQIPDIIEKYKIAIEQCKMVISQPIDVDLADDKLHAVLKGKRMAAEDVKFYAKDIDVLESELSGKPLEKTSSEEGNVVKKFTKQ